MTEEYTTADIVPFQSRRIVIKRQQKELDNLKWENEGLILFLKDKHLFKEYKDRLGNGITKIKNTISYMPIPAGNIK